MIPEKHGPNLIFQIPQDNEYTFQAPVSLPYASPNDDQSLIEYIK